MILWRDFAIIQLTFFGVFIALVSFVISLLIAAQIGLTSLILWLIWEKYGRGFKATNPLNVVFMGYLFALLAISSVIIMTAPEMV